MSNAFELLPNLIPVLDVVSFPFVTFLLISNITPVLLVYIATPSEIDSLEVGPVVPIPTFVPSKEKSASAAKVEVPVQ